jgi:hypothetical protein
MVLVSYLKLRIQPKESFKILRKIWGFHGGDYEECRLLGCVAV